MKEDREKPTSKSEPQPTFDSELSPVSERNTRAARARGLIFSSKKQAFVDADGALIRDRFGQSY